jgi:hypothetical protein
MKMWFPRPGQENTYGMEVPQAEAEGVRLTKPVAADISLQGVHSAFVKLSGRNEDYLPDQLVYTYPIGNCIVTMTQSPVFGVYGRTTIEITGGSEDERSELAKVAQGHGFTKE